MNNFISRFWGEIPRFCRGLIEKILQPFEMLKNVCAHTIKIIMCAGLFLVCNKNDLKRIYDSCEREITTLAGLLACIILVPWSLVALFWYLLSLLYILLIF